jgi:hypothetical protein
MLTVEDFFDLCGKMVTQHWPTAAGVEFEKESLTPVLSARGDIWGIADDTPHFAFRDR